MDFRFRVWMVEKGLWEKYEANFDFTKDTSEWLDIELPQNYLKLAFDWGASPEGFRFWSDTHFQWCTEANLKL